MHHDITDGKLIVKIKCPSLFGHLGARFWPLLFSVTPKIILGYNFRKIRFLVAGFSLENCIRYFSVKNIKTPFFGGSGLGHENLAP